MNYPPVFALISADSDANAILEDSDGIVRCFLFGEAPKDVQPPYMVWQVITGTPENCLDTPPDTDSFAVQLDCYDKTVAGVRALTEAARNALQNNGYVTSYRGEEREPDSNLYRVSFDWSAFVAR